jgi:chromosome segregation ATPase
MSGLIAGAIVSLLLVGGVIGFLKFKSGGGLAIAVEAIRQEIAPIDAKLEGFQQLNRTSASKLQFDTVTAQTTELTQTLQAQRSNLEAIEKRLEVAQKEVEVKEQVQQEIKSSKEEDEVKLGQLLANFGDMSSESVLLEQQLAQSLKNLDSLMNEVTMTDEQRAIFTDLSNAMTSAGGRLRELYSDYQAVNDRLEGLKAQHTDLEDEYTKLVEQQLGA